MRQAVNPVQGSAEDLVALLSRVARGDRDAFAKVYRATSSKLYGVILRILKRGELAEEVLQEVYVQVWQRASYFDPAKASPITWLSIVARNKALDEVRRRQPTTVEDNYESVAASPTASPARRHEASESLKRLIACLERLDGERSTAVQLAYLEGLSRQQLAERFGKPVGTIKSWLRQSLKQLKDCLGS